MVVPPPQVQRPVAPRGQQSPWLVAIVAAVAGGLLMAALYYWVLPAREGGATAAGKASTALETVGSAAGPKNHPLGKHLEISGVRVTDGKGGRFNVKFIVTNHSNAELPPLKVEAVVTAQDREFFRVPVTLASLGPYETRELEANVRSTLKPYELPDWQLIRPSLSIEDNTQ